MTRPAYLQTSLGVDRTDDVLSHLGSSSQPHLSIKGNRFTLVDAAGAEEPAGDLDKATGMMFFDCVIVDALEIESRIFYKGTFDPSATNYAPPDCWSDNGIAPSRNASVPQSPTCAACPNIEWGSKVSKVSGKGVPACSKYQKLALLPLGEDPGSPMAFLLRVPPNSLNGLRDYLNLLKKGNESYRNVVTRISFVKDTLGTLSFKALNYIDEPTCKQREMLYAAKTLDQLVNRGDTPRDGAAALPTPAAAAQIAAEGGTYTAPAQTQTALPAPAASPSEAPKRPGRPRKAAEAVADTPAPFRAEPAPAQNGAAPFGIGAPMAPDAELSKTIDSIFN